MSFKLGPPAYPYLKVRSKGGSCRSTLGTRPPIPGICDASPSLPGSVDPRLGVGLYDPAMAAQPASPSVRSSSPSVQSATSGAALGKSPDTLTDDIAETNERAKWASKRAAAKILFNDENPRLSALGKRISGCGYWNHSAFVDLQRNKATGRCSYHGVTTCGSVWACPVCSAKVSAKRQQELNDLLSRARVAGYSVFMLTQTFAHKFGDDLQVILDQFKAAQKRFRQLRGWRALKDLIVGTVSALELTHGSHSWHPHAHILVICKDDPAIAFERLDALRASWLAALESAGLSGGRAAWQLQDASAAAGYIAKWGAGEELAFHGAKSGRNGSRTPFKILADARDGCRRSAALFAEYVAAMIGRRQLIWSNGLKAMFQIGEVSDADAAQEADPPAEVEIVRSWPAQEWRETVRLRRVAVQFAVQAGRCLDAALSGPTDAQLWQRYLDESAVLE